MTRHSLLLASLFACKAPVLDAPAAAPAAPAAAPAEAPPLDPTCEPLLRDLRGAWGLMHTAAAAAPPTTQFLERWPALPPACRTGTWYLLAARRLREAPEPLRTPDGVTFTTAREALEAGLAAAPTDGGLLAFVTFGAGVSPDAFPPVPADACARIAPGDDHAYVCGSLALREGRFDAAANLLGALREPASYPDAALRHREALVGAGLAAPPASATPDRDARCAKFGATAAECARVAP